MPDTVTIPANERYVTVAIVPRDDSYFEQDETVALSVEPSTYTIGRPASATVTIVDDEQPSDLLLHFRLDESSGAIAADSSYPAYDGDVYTDATPAWTAGHVSGALQFDEASHVYVDAGDPADGRLDFGTTGDFTVAAWVNVSALPADQYTIVGKGDGGGNPRLLVKVASDGTVLLTVRDTDVAGSTSIVDGQWHHVAATCDRDAGAVVYIDGTSDGTGGVTTADDLDGSDPLLVGRSGDNRRYMTGLIDEVTVYGRALTQTEVGTLQSSGPSPALVAIDPNTGPQSGGTSVTIDGTTLLAGATVSFGVVEATNVVVTPETAITCDAPSGTGTVDVTVTNPDAQSAILAGGFTYIAPETSDSGCGQSASSPLPLASVLVALVAAALVVLRATCSSNWRLKRP